LSELKNKVVRGFAWNAAEKIATALFQFWVTIRIINTVSPGEYAPYAILLSFVAVFNTFVDSGFSQALIRKKEPTSADLSSVFWFNIAVSVVVYGLLVGLMWPAASILDMPRLTALAPLFYLIVPLGALGIVQQTCQMLRFDFGRLSAVTFTAIVAGGIVGVVMAGKGYGVWAYVADRVVQAAVRTLLLWIFGRWKPAFTFSASSIREMSGYSLGLLATDLMNNFYAKLPQFVIGGRMDKTTLGYYDNAWKFRDMPVTSVMNSMQAVTFPALANLRDDDRKFADGVGKVLSSIVFIMFPIMAGLIVVVADFFTLFLTSEWQGSVSFFRIIALTGLVVPVTTVAYNVMKTRSDGRTIFRVEILKKVLATVILAATVPFGPRAITWGMVGIALSDMVVTFSVGRRYCGYGPGRLARDVLPTLALTLFMAGAVWALGMVFDRFAPGLSLWVVLIAKILTGVLVYLGGAALLRLDAFGEFTGVVRKIAGKVRS
jgi:O-antigen/teichoic acid export membrane protein